MNTVWYQCMEDALTEEISNKHYELEIKIWAGDKDFKFVR